MDRFVLQAIFAGIMFGTWPLFLGKSGLSTSAATLISGLASFSIVGTFAIANGVSVAGSKWWLAVLAGCMGSIGVIAFNDAMIKSKSISIALIFIIMLVVQTCVPAAYHVYTEKQLSATTIAGFIAAIAACILLTLKR